MDHYIGICVLENWNLFLFPLGFEYPDKIFNVQQP